MWKYQLIFFWLTYHKSNVELLEADGLVLAKLTKSVIEEKLVDRTVAEESVIEGPIVELNRVERFTDEKTVVEVLEAKDMVHKKFH